MKLYVSLLAFLFSEQLLSSDRGMVHLRGFVPPAISTRITQTALSSNRSVVTFSSEVNSKYSHENQKIEIEGMDQEGVEAQLQMVTGNQRSISYRLLVTKQSLKNKNFKPLVLKISAN